MVLTNATELQLPEPEPVQPPGSLRKKLPSNAEEANGRVADALSVESVVVSVRADGVDAVRERVVSGERSFKEGEAYVVRNLYRVIDVSNCRGPVAGRIVGKAIADGVNSEEVSTRGNHRAIWNDEPG